MEISHLLVTKLQKKKLQKRTEYRKNYQNPFNLKRLRSSIRYCIVIFQQTVQTSIILRFDFRSLWNQNVCTLYHWYGHIFSHAFISLPKKKSESVFHSSNSPFLILFHFLSVNLFPSFFICILLIHIRVWHWSEKALRTTLTLSHFLVLFVCHTVYNVHRTAGTYLWIQYIYNNLAYYACIECILYCTHKTTTQFIRSAAAVDNCVNHAYVNPTLCLLLA